MKKKEIVSMKDISFPEDLQTAKDFLTEGIKRELGFS